MTMIADALKYVAQLQQQATAPVEIKGVDEHVKNLLYGGSRYNLDIAPSMRNHRVLTLEDLARNAERLDSPGDLVAWVNYLCVELVLNDSTHRDARIVFAFMKSEPWKRLSEWSGETREARKATAYSQADFIRLLRIDFAGTHDPVVLLNRVRRMTWTSVTTSERQTAKESMGRSIEAQAGTSAESIPEEITLTVPVFENPGERAVYPVRCAVEVLPEERQFRLTPLPGEVERVFGLALASIAERLAAMLPKDVPVYIGVP